jgi:7,8-dihydropterin-6-yl-methyl-4-(beta-D-ribofuranosyl)aminobenzene 5'-phosphate synthase
MLLALMLLAAPAPERVANLKITVLSTMLSDKVGIGEWGFAALVEVDNKRFLFDTGARPRTVLENARELKIDLASVTEVILTHNHGDHVGGLVTLRQELMKTNPRALSVAHVGRGAFFSRPGPDGEHNDLLLAKTAYESTGGRFIEHDGPTALQPGVWLTGPVPRIHDERNWSVQGMVKTPDATVEDNIPEDQSLIFDTPEGLVLLAGCGHAGFINIAEYARKIVRPADLRAAIGGFHLFPLDDPKLNWTIEHLRALHLGSLLGAHCTGIEAVLRIREGLHLDRKRCVVAAVGSSYSLKGGIDPLQLAH